MDYVSEAYERWMNDMCCEDRWCVKCGAWYASADPNERICDSCTICPEGECEERSEGYCDHQWESIETPSQIVLRQRATNQKQHTGEGR